MQNTTLAETLPPAQRKGSLSFLSYQAFYSHDDLIPKKNFQEILFCKVPLSISLADGEGFLKPKALPKVKKQSRRKSRQAPQLTHKSLKSSEKLLDLMRLPDWKNLPVSNKRFTEMFYPDRYCIASLEDLAEKWGISKERARIIVDGYAKKGWLSKRHRHSYHRHTGENLGNYLKTYYCLTKLGKAHLRRILELLNVPVRAFKTDRKTEKAASKYFKNIQKVFTPFTSKELSKLSKSKPREVLPTSSKFSFEYRKTFVFAEDCLASGTRPKHPKLSRWTFQAKTLVDGEKAKAAKLLFESFGFSKELAKAYRGTWLETLKYSLTAIQKLLKLIQHKLKNGWKLKSFWGFFNSEIKKSVEPKTEPKAKKSRKKAQTAPEESERAETYDPLTGKKKKPRRKREKKYPSRFAVPWFAKLSGEYREAADGKLNKLTQGLDTSICVEMIKKLEKQGQKKLSEPELNRIIRHGTEKMRAALEAVSFRHGLGTGSLLRELREKREKKLAKKGRPIYKQVKVNLVTKKPYTEEDRQAGAPYGFGNKIVGYEAPKKKPEPQAKPKPDQKNFTKIRSWIALTFYALKKGNSEKIQTAFYQKKEKPAKQRDVLKEKREKDDQDWASFDGSGPTEFEMKEMLK